MAASDDAAVIVGGGGTILRSIAVQTPPAIAAQPVSLTEALGGAASFTVRATVAGSGPLTYDWIATLISGIDQTQCTTSPTLNFTFTGHAQSRWLRLVVRNSRGDAVSEPISFVVLPDTPAITSQPFRVSAQTGRNVTLQVQKNETSGQTETAWLWNGRPLPRRIDPQYGVGLVEIYEYDNEAERMLNISTRAVIRAVWRDAGDE